MNTGVSWPDLDEAEPRVLAMQMKLHRFRRLSQRFALVMEPGVFAELLRDLNSGPPDEPIDRHP